MWPVPASPAIRNYMFPIWRTWRCCRCWPARGCGVAESTAGWPCPPRSGEPARDPLPARAVRAASVGTSQQSHAVRRRLCRACRVTWLHARHRRCATGSCARNPLRCGGSARRCINTGQTRSVVPSTANSRFACLVGRVYKRGVLAACWSIVVLSHPLLHQCSLVVCTTMSGTCRADRGDSDARSGAGRPAVTG
jgi:hypothetical protein